MDNEAISEPLKFIETQVTQNKIKLAEQEYLSASIQNGILLNTKKLIKKRTQPFFQLFRAMVLIVCFCCIAFGIHGLFFPEEICSRTTQLQYIFQLMMFILSAIYFIKIEEITKKINSKVIPYISKRTKQQIFKNLKNDYLPLIAHYTIDKQNLIYKRKIDNSEKLVWKKPLKHCRYFITANTVLIYSKPVYPVYIIFIDSDNVQSFINQLKSIGLESLSLPPLLPTHSSEI